jgi:PIN domain nuclease of toxin-antitoxin system
MLNLDTHILIHALTGELNSIERRLLSTNPLSISGIVLWEMEKLFQLGRINLYLTDPDLSRILNRIHVWPIDLRVCQTLREIDFESDPADKLIAATSLAHHVPLLTRDRKILKSRVVPFAS